MHFHQYQGEVMHGMRHGNGSFMFSNGSYYEGQWRNNLPNGLGIFYYSDGKYDAGTYKVLHDFFDYCRMDFCKVTGWLITATETYTKDISIKEFLKALAYIMKRRNMLSLSDSIPATI